MNRLYRSTTDRVFGGVCGGLAANLRVDPLIVRILFMLFAMANGTGLAVYVLLWLLIPSEASAGASGGPGGSPTLTRSSSQEPSSGKTRPLSPEAHTPSAQVPAPPQATGPSDEQWMVVLGGGLVIVGTLLFLDSVGLLWWFRLGTLWPLVLVGAGVVLLLNNLRGKR